MLKAPLTEQEFNYIVRVLISCQNDEQEGLINNWVGNLLTKKYKCGPSEIAAILVDLQCAVLLEKELGR